ncbi:MAG: hypothetical protein DMF04_04675 [Verrucomicrobia bacterium]|nr:MAG: hypothetical protein DMF04_04675 [Verrucomicrobiota bacterium]
MAIRSSNRGRGGAVTLAFIIGSDGTPQDIHVVSTTASPATTKAAVAWLQSCKGNPARRGKVLKISCFCRKANTDCCWRRSRSKLEAEIPAELRDRIRNTRWPD